MTSRSRALITVVLAALCGIVGTLVTFVTSLPMPASLAPPDCLNSGARKGWTKVDNAGRTKYFDGSCWTYEPQTPPDMPANPAYHYRKMPREIRP